MTIVGGQASTSRPFALPAGLVTDDLVALVMYAPSGLTPVPTGSGWTEVARIQGIAFHLGALWTRRWTAGDPTTVGPSGSFSGYCSGVTVALRGCSRLRVTAYRAADRANIPGLYNNGWNHTEPPHTTSPRHRFGLGTTTRPGTLALEFLMGFYGARFNAGSSPGSLALPPPTQPQPTTRYAAVEHVADGSGVEVDHLYAEAWLRPSPVGAVGIRDWDGLPRVPSTDNKDGHHTIEVLAEPWAAPDAPTLTAPGSGAAVSLASGGTFTWTHNHPDGLAQAAVAFRRTEYATGLQEWWTGSGWQRSEVFVAASAQQLVFPARVWPARRYLWSVATRDTRSQAGPYAADRMVLSRGGTLGMLL